LKIKINTTHNYKVMLSKLNKLEMLLV